MRLFIYSVWFRFAIYKNAVLFFCTLVLATAATVADIKICYESKTPQFAIFGTRIICVFYRNLQHHDVTFLVLLHSMLTLMLLLANLANTKYCKKKLKNNWQGLDVFQKFLDSCASDESSLSIGRFFVNCSAVILYADWSIDVRSQAVHNLQIQYWMAKFNITAWPPAWFWPPKLFQNFMRCICYFS